MSGDTIQILPEWNGSQKVLVCPSWLLRSSLFGVARTRTDKRAFFERVLLPSMSGIQIRYSGPRLTQSDLDVWHGTLVISKTPCSDGYAISGVKPFLKMIERQTGKTEREWLKTSLARLSATNLEITFGHVTFAGSLIDEYVRDEETGFLKIKLNPKLAELFSPWSVINWNQRSALQRKTLALWIHAFYSTHRTPFYYRVETIMEMCGSKSTSIGSFRQELKEALAEVADVTGWECRIDKGTDLLAIIKPRSMADLEGDDEDERGGMSPK